ncbi:ribonuclease PH [bacterium]|nr:MAG: ribonuclease PH [bacterium]QQR61521.1 MAG: ribonuclease PH [bacterium]QQR62951.1 MAG: ribonuclease PH [bacterium]
MVLTAKENLAIRPFSLEYDFITTVPAAVLIRLGKTKVLVTVSLQKGVPQFLKNSGQGWLTAEYSMLPHATTVRSARETANGQKNGRSVEISRLIGRVLRAVVDTDFGEQTLYIDCEVLEADGGTRAAAIIAASVALERAQSVLLDMRKIKKPFLKERVVAISVGIVNNTIVIDPTFEDDQRLHADFNIILTESGNLLELHGGAEKGSVSWSVIEQAKEIALQNASMIFAKIRSDSMGHDAGGAGQANDQKKSAPSVMSKELSSVKYSAEQSERFGLFSLKNRLDVASKVTK